MSESEEKTMHPISLASVMVELMAPQIVLGRNPEKLLAWIDSKADLETELRKIADTAFGFLDEFPPDQAILIAPPPLPVPEPTLEHNLFSDVSCSVVSVPPMLGSTHLKSLLLGSGLYLDSAVVANFDLLFASRSSPSSDNIVAVDCGTVSPREAKSRLSDMKLREAQFDHLAFIAHDQIRFGDANCVANPFIEIAVGNTLCTPYVLFREGKKPMIGLNQADTPWLDKTVFIGLES